MSPKVLQMRPQIYQKFLLFVPHQLGSLVKKDTRDRKAGNTEFCEICWTLPISSWHEALEFENHISQRRANIM